MCLAGRWRRHDARLPLRAPIVLEDTGPAAPAATPAVAPAPAPPPQAAFVAYEQKSGNAYVDRFAALWNDIHNPQNGYFSPEGVPYHAVETLLCEAPDHGHETTSEAYSYWLWLEAAYGNLTGDWTVSGPRLEQHGAVHHPDAGRPAHQHVVRAIASRRRTRPRATRPPGIRRS